MTEAYLLLLALVIGAVIIQVINYRLSQISINMPSVKAPQVVLLRDQQGGISYINPADEERYRITDDYPPLQEDLDNDKWKIERFQSYSREIEKPHQKVQPLNSTSTTPRNYGALITPRSLLRDDTNVRKPNPEPALGTTPRKSRCKTPVAFYKDPKDMTRAQLKKFKYGSRLEKMTVVDYTNWLMLFKDSPQRLNGFHRVNLRIINSGGKLTQKDLPRVTETPPTADHQYSRIVENGEDSLSNIPAPEFLGFQPSNYDELLPYDKARNRNLSHLNFVNEDEPLKTWELTRIGTGLLRKLF